MNHVRINFLLIAVASVLLFATNVFAQTPSPSPTPAPPENPFAPQPAPPLPAGMTGSDTNDPRAKLTPGVYDAGETSMGLKHITLLKKPDAFDLGTNDPNAEKVNKSLSTVLGIADPTKVPGAMKLGLAGLGLANSHLAIQRNHLFLGDFYGVNSYDISEPAKTTLMTS